MFGGKGAVMTATLNDVNSKNEKKLGPSAEETATGQRQPLFLGHSDQLNSKTENDEKIDPSKDLPMLSNPTRIYIANSDTRQKVVGI